MTRRTVAIWSIRLGAVALLVLVWWIVGRSGPGMQRVFPGASELGAAVLAVVSSDHFLADVWASTKAIFIGFGLGAMVGLTTGGIVGVSDKLTRLLEPMFYWASSVPKIILLPIMLLILGSGVALKAGHAFLSSVFPIAIGMITAVRTMKPIYMRVAQSFGVRGLRAVTHVWAPAASGQILTTLRIGLSNAMVSALLVETAMGSEGLGYRAVRYYANLQIPEMYALILIIFLSAMLVNIGLERVIKERTKHFDDARSIAV